MVSMRLFCVFFLPVDRKPQKKERKTYMKRMNLRALCEGAMMVALATALSFLKPYELPQGGSVCIGTLPLLLFAVRWGWRDGGLAGLAYGILQLLVDGAYAWGWASMLLDYGIAFSFLGNPGRQRRPFCGPLYQRCHGLPHCGPHHGAEPHLCRPVSVLSGV